MITYGIIWVFYKLAEGLALLFPPLDWFQIPDDIMSWLKNVGEWIDVKAFNDAVLLLTNIITYFGIVFSINWVIKRIRGG